MASAATTPQSEVQGEPGIGSPAELLARRDLRREDKIEILHQWEQDLREVMVAEEENMRAPDSERRPVTLDEVLDALRVLGAAHREPGVPTKHGG